jgi:hypothetical protein
MTDLTECQHVRQSLGVYVLGAIDPAERAEVDAHLAGCPDCRAELAGLAGLPALLGRVPVSEAARIAGFAVGHLSGQESNENERLAPGQDVPQAGDEADDWADDWADEPADTLSPLLAKMAQRRRVNRWRNLAAAAAVVIVAAGAAIGVVSAGGSPSAPSHVGGAVHWQQAQATAPGGRAHLVVRYAGMSWGTKLDASVTGIPAGTTCEFWVLGAHGGKWQAGGWTVTSMYQQSSYPGSSPVPASAVRGFEITAGHTVLVHVTA